MVVKNLQLSKNLNYQNVTTTKAGLIQNLVA